MYIPLFFSFDRPSFYDPDGMSPNDLSVCHGILVRCNMDKYCLRTLCTIDLHSHLPFLGSAIVCGGTLAHDWLTEEGMLSLQPQCMLSNDHMQLNSEISFGNVSELIVLHLNIVKDWALSFSAKREQIMNNITLTVRKR